MTKGRSAKRTAFGGQYGPVEALHDLPQAERILSRQRVQRKLNPPTLIELSDIEPPTSSLVVDHAQSAIFIFIQPIDHASNLNRFAIDRQLKRTGRLISKPQFKFGRGPSFPLL